MQKFDVLIIGGGAVGSAIAYRLAKTDLSVAVLEKELDVAMGTSGRNSGVVHAGFNNRPGSLMAELCVKGNLGFAALCETLDVPYRRSGKLVVGFTPEDEKALYALMRTGEQNGCIGLSMLDMAGVRGYEPNVPASSAMLSANTAVIDPFLYNIHLAETAARNGVTYLLGHAAEAVERRDGAFIISAGGERYACGLLINAAGLYADKVSAMAGDPAFAIYPCRGEYYLLDKIPDGLLSMPVYPVPRAGVGGLGVHLTPTVDHNLLLGPSAEYIGAQEDYATTAPTLSALMREAETLLPALDARQVIGSFAGVRPKLVAKGQANYGDFIIEQSPRVENLINLIGIESPGLTASMPIAEMVAKMVENRLHPGVNTAFDPSCRRIPCFREADEDTRRALIALDPDYGDVVCRCETVTRAEIRRALDNPLGARAIVSVKNRVRATMGRCNGGYCFFRIAKLLHEDYGVPLAQIAWKRADDHPFTGVVK